MFFSRVSFFGSASTVKKNIFIFFWVKAAPIMGAWKEGSCPLSPSRPQPAKNSMFKTFLRKLVSLLVFFSGK
jgi:hypothetical protein